MDILEILKYFQGSSVQISRKSKIFHVRSKVPIQISKIKTLILPMKKPQTNSRKGPSNSDATHAVLAEWEALDEFAVSLASDTIPNRRKSHRSRTNPLLYIPNNMKLLTSTQTIQLGRKMRPLFPC